MKKTNLIVQVLFLASLFLPLVCSAESFSKSEFETINLLKTNLSSTYPGSYFDGRDFIVYINLGEVSSQEIKSFKTAKELDSFRESFVESFYASASVEWAKSVRILFKNKDCGIIFVLSNAKKEVVVLRVDGRDF